MICKSILTKRGDLKNNYQLSIGQNFQKAHLFPLDMSSFKSLLIPLRAGSKPLLIFFDFFIFLVFLVVLTPPPRAPLPHPQTRQAWRASWTCQRQAWPC